MARTIVALGFMVLVGCGSAVLTSGKGEFVRLFMHEPGQYSVLTKDLDNISFRDLRTETTLFTDVPINEPMWYKGEFYRGGDGHWKWVHIHIHSPKDVNGAGWKTPGKFARDVGTVVVE